jgi:uncharacterized protein
MGSALLAFSGGVDSSLLLLVGRDVLGDRMKAVTLHSPLHPRWEAEEAVAVARSAGVHLEILDFEGWNAPGIQANGPDRCYHCKRALMTFLLERARERGLAWVMEGSHADDDPNDRPGMRALEELGIRSPLREAGLHKEEIRLWAKELGLPHWDRPPRACLATRIPTGERITLERLGRIERAEEVLRKEGFRQFRARDRGRSVLIQVDPDETGRLLREPLRRRITEAMTKAGFQEVWLDLKGYGAA